MLKNLVNTFIFIRQRLYFDAALSITIMALLLIGIIMVASTTSVVGASTFGDGFYHLKRHLIFMVLGIGLFMVGNITDHQVYKKWVMPGFFGSLAVLSLTLIPGVGTKLGGAQRWINLGFFQFQPVELMKFFITVFLASALTHKASKIDRFSKGVAPILMMVCLPILVLSQQPDLGNIILIVMVTFSLLFVANIPVKHLLTFAATALTGIVTSIALYPYQLERIKIFLDPWADPLGRSYHIIQSYTAIGSGGILGHGFGQSKLKFFYLPLHYSDFIFSIICEEGGLIFASIVVLLFLNLLFQGFRISREATAPFSSYLAVGLTLFLCIQACLNIGVVIGLFPITGIPLTFISYGGTSLVVSLFSCGVLMNIAKGNR